MRRVLIRPDWGPLIGLGHLTRCLALADQLIRRCGAQIEFAGPEPDPASARRIGAASCGVVPLQGAEGSLEEADSLARRARRSGCEVVVLDSYKIGPSYLDAVLRSGALVVVVDDLAALDRYPCHLLVNGNLYAPSLHYRLESGTRPLLGGPYLMLRTELSRDVPRCPRRPAGPAKRVLVTLGGADRENRTLRILKSLEGLGGSIELSVLVGPYSPHSPLLREFAKGSGPRVQVHRDPPDLTEQMRRADIAVSASGTTAYELAYAGVPSILLAIADNQRRIAAALAKAGAAINVGDFRDAVPAGLPGIVRELVSDDARRERMSASGPCLIDGRGAERVASAIAEAL